MAISFYGGQQGKSFKISKIFKNKVEMMQDLIQRWQSPIGIGELVFISYGIPNDDDGDYLTNRDVDLQTAPFKTYNSTLWQKIYTEEDSKYDDELTGLDIYYVSEDYGFGYKLVASLTGNTPKLTLGDTQILNANENPRVEPNYDDLDSPTFTFYLPQSQVLDTEIVNVELDADGTPLVEFSGKGDANNQVNHPQLKFSLPQSQVMQDPEVIVEDANYQPSVEDVGDVNEPKLNFHLPKSQIMQQPETTVIPPSDKPSVKDEGTVNEPKLNFSLPRAIKFMYGDLLGLSSEGTYQVEKSQVEGLEPGDYYINKSTGFVYLMSAGDDSHLTATFQARLSAPIPTVSTSSSAAYVDRDGHYERNTSRVVSSYTDPVEETGWTLSFTIPNLPEFTVDAEFLGSDDSGSVEGKIVDTETFNYKFFVPRGTRFFSGKDISGESSTFKVEGALNGDYYLNTNFGNKNDGNLYKFDGENWTLVGSIKGDIGDALNITDVYTITEDLGIEDNLNAVSAYIETQYTEPIDNTMIFAVNYIEGKDTRSYWYFKVKDKWDRASLTGGIGNLLIGQYDGRGINDTQGYTVKYIDTIISNEKVSDTDEKKRRGYSVEFIDKLFQGIKDLILNDTAGASSENLYSAEYINTLLDKAKQEAIENAKLYWKGLGDVEAKIEFSVNRGNVADLPKEYVPGSIYFAQDEKILYIDIDDHTRAKLNAAGASMYITDEGEEIPLSDFVQKKDVIDTAHGGTGVTSIPKGVLYGDAQGALKAIANGVGALFAVKSGELQYGNLPITNGGTGAASAADARSNLSVYSKQEIDDNATSVPYEVTLANASWVTSKVAEKGFEYVYANAQLKCGKSGKVPPIVTATDNQDDYNKIDSAEANPNVGITFYAKKKPEKDIPIIIVDVK